MPDIMTREKRSALMSRIRGRDTGIEKLILSELKRRNIDTFKYQLKMVGNPDFVFTSQRIVVFCDGDFWHGYKFQEWEDNLKDFWKKKIKGNMERDKKIRMELKKDGWKVVRLWGHEINKNPARCVDRIEKMIDDLR